MTRLLIISSCIFLVCFYNSNAQEPDTTSIESPESFIEDSTDVISKIKENIDSTDEETEFTEDSLEVSKPWTIDCSLDYESKKVKKGVDVSGSQPLIDLGVGLSHEFGISTGFDISRRVGAGAGFQDFSFNLGYDWNLSESFSMSLGYNYSKYVNDSISAIAGANNDLSLSCDYTSGNLLADLTYDRLFGNDAINYLTLNFMYLTKIYDFRLLPMLSISWTSFEIQKKRLVKKANNTLGVKTTTVKEKGLSSISLSMQISYKLGKGFSVKMEPGYYYSPKSTLSKKSSNFIFSLGLSYSLDF